MAQKEKNKKSENNKEKDVIVELSSKKQDKNTGEKKQESTKESQKETKKGKKEKNVSLKKYEELEKQMEEREKAFEEMKDKYFRLAAEFDNFKKRIIREFEMVHKYAGEKVLREIVPIFDDLARALDNEPESEQKDNSGLTMIFKKFDKVLSDLEVTPIKSVGETFDPDFHHALMVREEEGVDADIVLEEFEKGYKYKDRVLKHAKVVVSK